MTFHSILLPSFHFNVSVLGGLLFQKKKKKKKIEIGKGKGKGLGGHKMEVRRQLRSISVVLEKQKQIKKRHTQVFNCIDHLVCVLHFKLN